jgi:hypothetical protein
MNKTYLVVKEQKNVGVINTTKNLLNNDFRGIEKYIKLI